MHIFVVRLLMEDDEICYGTFNGCGRETAVEERRVEEGQLWKSDVWKRDGCGRGTVSKTQA